MRLASARVPCAKLHVVSLLARMHLPCQKCLHGSSGSSEFTRGIGSPDGAWGRLEHMCELHEHSWFSHARFVHACILAVRHENLCVRDSIFGFFRTVGIRIRTHVLRWGRVSTCMLCCLIWKAQQGCLVGFVPGVLPGVRGSIPVLSCCS